MGREFELKFRAAPEVLDAIRAEYGPFSPITMETTYYDTPDRRMGARKETLRRRYENGTAVYALKTYLGSIWAPDICKYEDKYYIYFTVAHPKGRMNFVTWAESPYGPWSDPIDLKVGNIDPCHVVGEDGSRWLFMSAGKRVRLTDDGLAIIPAA